MPDKRISDLPVAEVLNYNSMLPAEQDGIAVRISGQQIAAYAQSMVEPFAEAAEAHAADARQYSGNPPIIRNDTWWIWSAEQQAYVDTNQRATLDLSAINFFIDMETGNLCMGTQE